MSDQFMSMAERIGGRRRWRSPDVRDVAAGARERFDRAVVWSRRRPRTAGAIGVAAALMVASGLWLALRPVPKPDYSKDRIDAIFRYTLLTDEFNRLPIEERVELVGMLVGRVKSMGAGDSTLLAAFAAGIAGAAREQLEENASRLAIDLWDKYASEYEKLPADQREGFLDMAFVEFSKTMEALGGEVRDVSDAERLAEARREAAQGAERGMPGRFVGRMFGIMNSNIGGHASPLERARGAQMMRDMTRRLRGQPISGG